MKERLLAHLRALIGERHPITSPRTLSEVEAYLIAQFRQFGCTVATHAFPALGGIYKNVIASLPSQKQASPLIIAAHFDTVEHSPGADDNASGLAVLLETARNLANISLRRPIRFIAFCLEEEDLL
ncbi:MAG: M28 family peptidase, partial [Nitrospiraceae bacterium]